jgi:hypothetical protein
MRPEVARRPPLLAALLATMRRLFTSAGILVRGALKVAPIAPPVGVTRPAALRSSDTILLITPASPALIIVTLVPEAVQSVIQVVARLIIGKTRPQCSARPAPKVVMGLAVILPGVPTAKLDGCGRQEAPGVPLARPGVMCALRTGLARRAKVGTIKMELGLVICAPRGVSVLISLTP